MNKLIYNQNRLYQMNFNQFRNLSRIKDLPVHEQNRQWFIHQSNMIYESSIPAAAASSAAGSGGNGGLLLYGFSIDLTNGIFGLNSISKRGSQSFTGVTFSGITVFEKNPDDGYNYFITNNYNESSMVFGKVKDGVTTIIDTENLTSLTNNAPGSLYYEGSGNFIYLDGCPAAFEFSGYTHSNIIRVDTDGNCEMVYEGIDISSISPSCLFPYGEEIWGCFSYYGTVAGFGPFDMEAGSFIDTYPLSIEGMTDIPNYKVWFALGSQIINEEIYLSLYVSNKDTSQYFQCIVKLDIEAGYANFVTMINPLEDYSIIFDITTL